jgi:hypothetical protein
MDFTPLLENNSGGFPDERSGDDAEWGRYEDVLGRDRVREGDA